MKGITAATRASMIHWACSMAESIRVLYDVAKQPAAGQTKTRLCPPLNGAEAAALYAAFLAHGSREAAWVRGQKRTRGTMIASKMATRPKIQYDFLFIACSSERGCSSG